MLNIIGFDPFSPERGLSINYSIAAAHGGLTAVLTMAYMSLKKVDIDAVKHTLSELKDFVIQYGVGNHGYLKNISPQFKLNPMLATGIDSSLLGLAVPFGMFKLDEPVMERIIGTIKNQLLSPDGGVYRYLADTY